MSQHAELISKMHSLAGIVSQDFIDAVADALQAMEPPGCDSCPHNVGDAYQRDCCYPDCSPKATERKPMTEEDMSDIAYSCSGNGETSGFRWGEFGRKIEAFHGIQPPNVKGE